MGQGVPRFGSDHSRLEGQRHHRRGRADLDRNQQGPLETPKGTVEPSGKRISIRACNVFEIDPDSGKAKLQRHYFDMATLLRQIGAF